MNILNVSTLVFNVMYLLYNELQEGFKYMLNKEKKYIIDFPDVMQEWDYKKTI